MLTKEQRSEFERSLRVLREEYNHYKLFADVLETATGQPVSNESLKGWQLDEDKALQAVRQRIREQEGAFGELAIMFTEGGGSAFFLVGRDIKGDAISEEIARACNIVYTDELEHGEHGALDLEQELEEGRELLEGEHVLGV